MQTFSEKKVQDMIAEVDSAIETLLKSEKDALIKLQKGASGVSIPQTQDAAQGGLAKGGEDASAAPVAESSAEKKPDPSPSASPADAGPPAADASAPAPAPDPMAAGAPGADASASAPPTEQELVEAYGQLSQPELQLHAKALASVMAAQAGAQSPAAAPGASPSAPAPMAASPSPSPAAPAPMAPGASPLPADQSMPVDPSVAAMKSENSLLRGQVADLQKGLAAFTDGFKELLAPKQKAVTAMDVVAETPRQSLLQLTKSEIGTKLATVVKTDLSKSDRKLINRWYNGEAGDAELNHLLSK